MGHKIHHRRVTGDLGAQKQGKEHFSFTSVEPLVINTPFGDLHKSLLCCTWCARCSRAAPHSDIYPFCCEHPSYTWKRAITKNKTENAFLKVYVEFTLSLFSDWITVRLNTVSCYSWTYFFSSNRFAENPLTHLTTTTVTRQSKTNLLHDSIHLSDDIYINM